MKTIKLKCKTLGLNFGDTVDVGSKKGQIKEEEAQSLVNEGLAEEVKPVVDGTKENLQKKITELENSLAEKDAKITELENSLAEKDAKITELENSLAEKDAKSK